MNCTLRVNLTATLAMLAFGWLAVAPVHAITNLVWQAGAGYRFATLPVPKQRQGRLHTS